MDSIIAAARQGTKPDGIPKITNLDSEKKKRAKKSFFKARIFLIEDDTDAGQYADFMNMLISGEHKLLREESTWTQHGELKKFVEYMEDED